MRKVAFRFAVAFLSAGVFAAAPALADKPDRSEQHEGKGKKQKKEKKHEAPRDEAGGPGKGPHEGRGERHFAERQQAIVRDYYGEQFRGGKCPPGLAKKKNGCLPPGQAKKWRIGRPLPRDVVFYELPPALVVNLGPPPPQHRYVRVAADILLIAVGTSIVVDAIQDLGRI